MAAYEYVTKGLYKAPAQQVGELFEQLQHSETGLTPKSVLDAARAENSFIHDEFEWDNDVAAEKYRLKQAQNMILNVRVIVRETTDQEMRNEWKERGFVCTPGGKSVYVTLQSALNNDEWHKHLMKQAKDEMESFIAKYRRLDELSEVIKAMQDVQAKAD